jgi:hypothetical protein
VSRPSGSFEAPGHLLPVPGMVVSIMKRNGSSKSDFKAPAKLSEEGFDG